MGKCRYEYKMHSAFRKTKVQKEAFVKWAVPFYKKHGRKPTPGEVVDEFKRKGSPLKCIMEDDPRKAAESYWHREAQRYIQHLQIRKVDIRTGIIVKPEVRAFVPIKVGYQGKIKESDYVHAKRVAASPVLKHSVVQKALSDFRALIDRYKDYAEFMDTFASVVKEFERVCATVEKLKEKGDDAA